MRIATYTRGTQFAPVVGGGSGSSTETSLVLGQVGAFLLVLLEKPDCVAHHHREEDGHGYANHHVDGDLVADRVPIIR